MERRRRSSLLGVSDPGSEYDGTSESELADRSEDVIESSVEVTRNERSISCCEQRTRTLVPLISTAMSRASLKDSIFQSFLVAVCLLSSLAMSLGAWVFFPAPLVVSHMIDSSSNRCSRAYEIRFMA